MTLLGLGPVPGSTIGTNQDLALTIPSPEDFRVIFIGTNTAIAFTTVSNALYDLQACSSLSSGSWSNLTNNIVGNGGIMTNLDNSVSASSSRFYRLRLHF